MGFQLPARRLKCTVRDFMAELEEAGCRWYGSDRLVGKQVENEEYTYRVQLMRRKLMGVK